MAATKQKATAVKRPEIEKRVPHLPGCPDSDRTESYPAIRPNGETLTVARCVECGEAIVE